MAGEVTKAIDSKTLWGGGRSPFSVSYGKIMMWFFLVSDALSFTGLLVGFGYARHSLPPELTWPKGEVIFQAMPFLGDGFPLLYVALMTFILIISSVTMVLAVEAGHRMDKRGVVKWLFFTVIGGFFFLGSQVWEWKHFIHGSAGQIVTADGQIAYLTEEIGHGESAAEVADFGLLMAGIETPITGSTALEIYEGRVHFVQGANMTENEYGPPAYANFFFFITGFHGFHVFTGVLINILILIAVIKGVYHRRGHYEMVEKAGLYWHFVDLVWVFVFTFFYLV
jgi:cytochrome c oxidase subunit 3